MNKLNFIISLYGLLLCLSCYTIAMEPITITKKFIPSNMLFPNPERGWIAHRYSDNMARLEKLLISEEKVSLILIQINISDYHNINHISKEKLDKIRAALDQCRFYGLKAILRSAYGWCRNVTRDPESVETIATHVMDMKGIYNGYKHIIIAVEMGMFGPYGEMHSSKHIINRTRNNRKIYRSEAIKLVHKAYMSALPETHSVLVRRPFYIRQILGDDTPLTVDEAYSNTAKARTGYHNDAYLHNKDDDGTFVHGWTQDQELDYINKVTRFTFFGGEAFGTPNGEYNHAKNALNESKRQHMTYLNRGYQKEIYNAWGNDVKKEFTRKLGYRFELKSISYSKQVAPGGILNFHLKLQNTGFAAMYLNRPVNLILDNGKTGTGYKKYIARLTEDPQRWAPEAGIISIHRQLRIPAFIKGSWRLLLALPDASEELRSDPRYAVRFANDNIWDDHDGTNVLIEKLSVLASASGVRTADNVFKEITVNV